MADQPNEFIEYLGIDPASPTAKEDFQKKFIPRDSQAIKDDKDLYGKVTGAYNEANKGLLKRYAKDNGIDLSAFDIDSMDVKGIFTEVIPTVLKEKNTLIESLKQETTKGVDKKLQEFQQKFDAYKAEVEPKINAYETKVKEFDDYRNSVAEEKKIGKINDYKTGAWKEFKFGSGVKDLEKKGFEALIESKYKIALDETGNAFPTNDKGERFPGKQAGTYKTFAELLAEEGKAAGIMAVTDSNPKPMVRQTLTPTPEAVLPTNPGERKRIVNTAGRKTVA